MEIKLKRSAIYTIILTYILVSFSLSTSLGISDYFQFFSAFISTIILLAYCIFVARKISKGRSETYIIISSYIVKIFLLLMNLKFDHFIESYLAIFDSFGFYRDSMSYYLNKNTANLHLYPRILVFLYHIFGGSEYVASLINIFLSVLTAIYFTDTINLFHKNKFRVPCIFAVCFSPYIICYNLFILRESIYIFSISASIFYFTNWIFFRNIKSFIVSLFFILPSVLLHGGHISVAFSYVIIYLLNSESKKEKKKIPKFYILIFFVLIVFAFFNNFFRLSYVYFGNAGILGSIRSSYLNHFIEGAGSRYLEWMSTPENWIQFALYTPLRIIYFLLSPLPTEWRGAKDIISFLSDSTIHFYGCYCIIYSLNMKKNSNRHISNEVMLSIKTCSCIILMVSFVFSWGTASAGTAIRHRLCLIPIECLAIFIKHTYFS